MRVRIAGCIVLALVLAGPADALADLYCDGDPPKLKNEDATDYTYRLECGPKSETGRIGAAAEIALKGKSGCVLKLGDNAARKLYTEMVCTIRGGKLSCELI